MTVSGIVAAQGPFPIPRLPDPKPPDPQGPDPKALGEPSLGSQSIEQPSAQIAASSDLGPALIVLARTFELETGTRVDLALGASRTLMQHAREGAPYDVFISADLKHVAALADDELLVDRGVPFADGQLSILVHRSNPLAANLTLASLATAMKGGRVQRVALPDPADDIYGQSALDVLNQLRLMEFARPRMVYTPDVADAADKVVAGVIDVGIVASSLTMTDAARSGCRTLEVNPSWHRKLSHHVALTAEPDDTARALYAYLQSPQTRQLLRSYGYVTPT
jgi:molybdate transport system substrate-binding protein